MIAGQMSNGEAESNPESGSWENRLSSLLEQISIEKPELFDIAQIASEKVDGGEISAYEGCEFLAGLYVGSTIQDFAAALEPQRSPETEQ